MNIACWIILIIFLIIIPIVSFVAFILIVRRAPEGEEKAGVGFIRKSK